MRKFVNSLLMLIFIWFQVLAIVPVIFVIICLFLVILPIYEKPWEVVVGTFITLTGIPAYYLGVEWRDKPQWFTRGLS